jgi:hypothetical protein
LAETPDIKIIRRSAFNEVRLEIKEPDKRLAGSLVLAWLLAVACSCSPRAGSTGGEAKNDSRASSAPAGATAPLAGDSAKPVTASASALDFTLINFTGLELRAIYLSPHDSVGWEENVLGRDELFDGGIVEIKFAPEEKAVMWDLRAEDKDGNNAEWKNLNLREISRITLRRGKEAAIAEAE